MRSLPGLCAVAVLLAGCGGGAPPSAPTASGPSGSLGVVTAEAAADAVGAMCQMRRSVNRDEANALFFDRVHQTLHALAAATEVVDRIPAAGLLEAKQAVEADLQAETMPQSFSADVADLLGATRDALATVALPDPGC
ncbi:MAG: hypothetical protein ABI635_03465 [Actinomycetota bacterium]